MTDIEERHAELLAIDDSPNVRRVVRMLDEFYSTRTPPRAQELDRAMFQLIRDRSATTQPSVRRRVPRPLAGIHGIQLVSAVAAVVIAVGALVVRLNQRTVTPVSAQTILIRAAHAGLESGEATHFVYDLAASDGYAGTENVWIEANERRGVARLALTITMYKHGVPAPALDAQLVQTGHAARLHDPGTNTATSSPLQQPDVPWLTVAEGTALTRKRQIIASSSSRAAKGLLQKVQLLPERSFDGVAVDVLCVKGGQTFYFEAEAIQRLKTGFENRHASVSLRTVISSQIRIS